MSNREDIRDRIIHVLRLYPIISPSMLQMGLGPNVAAHEWRPVLDDMVSSGDIIQSTTTVNSPSGRHNTYTRLSLKGSIEEIVYGGI